MNLINHNFMIKGKGMMRDEFTDYRGTEDTWRIIPFAMLEIISQQ